MLTHVIVEEAKFQRVYRLLCFSRNLSQSNPDQHRYANMIALRSSQTALTAFNPCDLLQFAVKNLYSPTDDERLAHVVRSL